MIFHTSEVIIICSGRPLKIISCKALDLTRHETKELRLKRTDLTSCSRSKLVAWGWPPGSLPTLLFPLTHTAWPSNRPKGTSEPFSIEQVSTGYKMVGFWLFSHFSEPTGGNLFSPSGGICGTTWVLTKHPMCLHQARSTKRSHVHMSKEPSQRPCPKVNAGELP